MIVINAKVFSHKNVFNLYLAVKDKCFDAIESKEKVLKTKGFLGLNAIFFLSALLI
ncbi:MAG: hypothetical protein ABL887_06035 [Nitrosomonas sp.]|jgi:hypothetical protein